MRTPSALLIILACTELGSTFTLSDAFSRPEPLASIRSLRLDNDFIFWSLRVSSEWMISLCPPSDVIDNGVSSVPFSPISCPAAFVVPFASLFGRFRVEPLLPVATPTFSSWKVRFIRNTWNFRGNWSKNFPGRSAHCRQDRPGAGCHGPQCRSRVCRGQSGADRPRAATGYDSATE